MDRPKKEEHDAKLVEINATFEKLKEERRKIQETIDETMNAGSGKGATTAIGKEREAMQVLRAQKQKLIDEKRAIRSQLDVLKVTGDKLAKDRKDTRSSVKFSTIEEINAEVAKMQKLQETTSMSLTEEKKLIKEMDQLKASKGLIKDLQSKETDLNDVKTKRKAISDSISAKDKEIDAVSKEMDILGAKIKGLSETETDKRGTLDVMFKQRDQFKKDIAAVLKEKDAIRDEFREKNNAWWNNQRAVKAQMQMKYEAERKAHAEEKKAYLQKKEEEEAKKIPYEEEQALCDYLADYLERTYLKIGGDGDESKVAVKKEDVIAVKEDYFGKGKGKKKRQRQPKKQAAAGPFTLNVDSFEQFGLLGLNPPTSLDMVEKSVKDLREKKEWYKQQPRGSVPTATDIRKQNQKAAAKLRQGDGGAAAPVQVKSGGKFSLSSDEFVPLGKGASSAVDVSSWGQKPPAEVEEPALVAEFVAGGEEEAAPIEEQ
jgi:uncharacterized coiled-coil DUF342 family protein